MADRDLSKKYRVTGSERGVALFTAMMLLVLTSGFAFFMLQNATIEMQISNEANRANTHLYTTESAIEQALAWVTSPAQSPDNSFFSDPCNLGKRDQDFSYFMKNIGEQVNFQVQKPSTKSGPCLLEITPVSGKKMFVKLLKNPMPIIPHQDVLLPVTIDSELEGRMNEIKRFAKRFGRYYVVVSEKGVLAENGISVGTFDTVFNNKDSKLVYIHNMENMPPLKIGKGHYKGYFYFSGDIEIEGNDGTHEEISPPDLTGFFYARGKIIADNPFSVEGALHSGLGFEGEGLQNITIKYNDAYGKGVYPEVLPFFPITQNSR
jgi:hypothetical protein